MIDDEIRSKAVEFLDGQHVDDKAFYDAVHTNILAMPTDRTGLKYCPACESAACGVCGQCHQLDKKILFVGANCPQEVTTPYVQILLASPGVGRTSSCE